MQIIESMMENHRVFLLNLTAKKACEARQAILADNLFYTHNSTQVWIEVLALVNLCAELGLIGELKTLLTANGGFSNE